MADNYLYRQFEDMGFTRAGLLKAWVKRGNTYHDTALLQRLFNPK